MDDDRVAFARVGEQRLKLRPIRVFAGGGIREHAVEIDAFELSLRVLIEGTDSHVPDPLPLPRYRHTEEDFDRMLKSTLTIDTAAPPCEMSDQVYEIALHLSTNT
ncbi:MAG: hypothetical protein BroJett003_01680 [Planctomycetota bacterium]|nr:MAG: hypothetical protein BroJett003_01680 [Planctomycetota bacterium]